MDMASLARRPSWQQPANRDINPGCRRPATCFVRPRLSCKITSMKLKFARPFVSLAAFAAVLTLLSLSNSAQVSGRPRTAPSASPTPVVLSSPSPTPAATPMPVAIETIESLQTKIRQRLFAPEVRRGRIGIKVVSLTSGRVIIENDSDKYFMPASNMKNFTVATAMERLGPEFRFVTSVYANVMPDASGTIKGDLRIFGRGDVSISTAFFGTTPDDPNTYFKGIDRLVERISAAGVKRIDGSIVADESYFKGFYIPDTWEWDDLQSYYGAELSALPINDNAVDLAVSPGKTGAACAVSISPGNTLFQILNTCVTTPTGTKRELSVLKKIDRNVIEIAGTMAAGDSTYRSPIAVTHPAELFVALLKSRLESAGIVVTGGTRSLPANVASPANQIEIAKLESPPFREIAAKTMKPSQNMFTETILWTLGEQVGRPAGASGTSSAIGLSVVRGFLKQIGVPDDGIVQYDGSGLSRHDLITPSAVVAVYTFMAKQSKYSQQWRDSLSIGGVDGTLKNRFKGTAAAGNIRGKTGTIDQVSALSGYMTTAGGEQLILSIVVNGVAEPRTRTSLIDDIVVNLANFNGKLDQ
jgi:D-alanyl-D-alanine carboxypeptidase/D-alanyl-D-alanine-endopeptidase (penicillin-binding protein 4)